MRPRRSGLLEEKKNDEREFWHIFNIPSGKAYLCISSTDIFCAGWILAIFGGVTLLGFQFWLFNLGMGQGDKKLHSAFSICCIVQIFANHGNGYSDKFGE